MVTPASAPTTTSSHAREWTTSGDPAFAFRGLSRGLGTRGRGGSRGGGRGGRSGSSRQAKLQGAMSPAHGKESVTKATKEPDKPPADEGTTKSITEPGASSGGQPRAGGRSRKGSRNVPQLSITPGSARSDGPLTLSSGDSTTGHGRRRRGPKTPASAGLPNLHLHPDSRSGNSRNRSRMPRPPLSAPIVKDIPPHLSTAFQSRIDAMVERARAAVIEVRPNTPGSGSHIDWAGDDDDGDLPDLDDWGVKPTVSESDVASRVISPIFVDGLKALPEPFVKPPSPAPSVEIQPMAPLCHVDENMPNGGQSSSALLDVPQTAVARLSPSLPPKPIGPMSHRGSHGTKPSPMRGHAAYNVHSPCSSKNKSPAKKDSSEAVSTALMNPNPPAVDATRSKSVEDTTSSLVMTTGSGSAESKSETHGGLPSHKARLQGLEASIHAPGNRVVESTEFTAYADAQLNPFGLEASIHAPKDLKTHNRSFTTGRTVPHSPPAHRNHRTVSATATPHDGRLPNVHARTHSTPPVSGRVHASRPIISGDALSRIARSLGGSGVTPLQQRVSAVAGATE
ncbi:hypothetical protein FISHEDRAFT_72851 [Fistulina hepatica ATCC 64428]|nr:hypothetical protein FISHEDRAFT_72851 [Fistulina hepatica ATCC 64428]